MMQDQQEETNAIEQSLHVTNMRSESTLSSMTGACEADSQIAKKERSEEEFAPIADIICCSSMDSIFMNDEEAPKRLPTTQFNQHLLSPVTIKSQVPRQEGKELGPEYQRRGRFLVWPASLGIPSCEVST
jgi:hypothetical protein